jgi:hypothetical protein
VYPPTVPAAAQTSSSAAEALLETAARSKAGAAIPPPTAATTVSPTLERAVLLPTPRPTANAVQQTAISARARASATVVLVLDGAAIPRRLTAVLDARLASATAPSSTLEMCLSTAHVARMERPARVARTETAALRTVTAVKVMISVLRLAVSRNSATAVLRLVFLPMVIVAARTASPAREARLEVAVLQKVTAEQTSTAAQDVKLLSASATPIPVPSLLTAAAEASMGRPAKTALLETVVQQVAGAAARRSTAMLAVKPSSALATALPARSPQTVVAEALTVRSAKEVLSASAVRQRPTAVTPTTVMRAAKPPSVPAKTAPATSPRTGAVARTERLARAALSGTVAPSMDGVEQEPISVAMDVSWRMAFAPTSPPTRSVDPGTGRLVQGLVLGIAALRMGSAELLVLTVGRAVRRDLPVLA